MLSNARSKLSVSSGTRMCKVWWKIPITAYCKKAPHQIFEGLYKLLWSSKRRVNLLLICIWGPKIQTFGHTWTTACSKVTDSDFLVSYMNDDHLMAVARSTQTTHSPRQSTAWGCWMIGWSMQMTCQACPCENTSTVVWAQYLDNGRCTSLLKCSSPVAVCLCQVGTWFQQFGCNKVTIHMETEQGRRLNAATELK